MKARTQRPGEREERDGDEGSMQEEQQEAGEHTARDPSGLRGPRVEMTSRSGDSCVATICVLLSCVGPGKSSTGEGEEGKVRQWGCSELVPGAAALPVGQPPGQREFVSSGSSLWQTFHTPASFENWTTGLHKGFLTPHQAVDECRSWRCREGSLCPQPWPWHLPKEA
ncbi:hypothetical protein HPG69_004069 [Diceros bicornis minor]|uniref:Uncharacterized protein n=1 Tax=Diceros bicornis minor TaxID=77932 RepID=A0A7J7E9I2_DICBM|nr:hypothetical protein HPG69_004069 [Diceros bicornis minor]